MIDVRSTVLGGQPAVAPQGGTGSPVYDPGSSSSSSSASSNAAASTTKRQKTAGQISSSAPETLSASNYDELIAKIEKRMAQLKPLSDEELEKLRRRQRTEGIISGVSDAARSIANLISTHHYAPNMYNHSEGMSAKAKARFDREKAQRDADADKYMQYALMIGRLKGEDKERAFRIWQTEQSLARQDQAFEAGRKDREDDVAFRDKSFDRQGEWHDEETERWKLQFKVSSENERARINIAAQQLAQSRKEKQMTFNLGSGYGNVTLPLDRLNAETVSMIFNTLPESALYHPKMETKKGEKEVTIVTDSEGNIVYDHDKPKLMGDPIVANGIIRGYKPPSTETMLIAIGANVENSEATREAIRQVAGLEKRNEGTMPGVE